MLGLEGSQEWMRKGGRVGGTQQVSAAGHKRAKEIRKEKSSCSGVYNSRLNLFVKAVRTALPKRETSKEVLPGIPI